MQTEQTMARGISMDVETFRNWLERYIRSQEQCQPEAIKDLFAEEGVFWWGPFNEARHGVDQICSHHKNALSHQENTEYEYEILAVRETYGIAKFRLSLNDLVPCKPDTYEGIFLVYLNDENKCTLFQQWYNSTIQR